METNQHDLLPPSLRPAYGRNALPPFVFIRVHSWLVFQKAHRAGVQAK